MTSLFRNPQSRPDPPPTPDPEAIPDVSPEASDTARRKIARRRGFPKTILAGALTPDVGKRTTLG